MGLIEKTLHLGEAVDEGPEVGAFGHIFGSGNAQPSKRSWEMELLELGGGEGETKMFEEGLLEEVVKGLDGGID